MSLLSEEANVAYIGILHTPCCSAQSFLRWGQLQARHGRRPGDKVLRGERIGMIRFGSRVEVTIPKGLDLLVKNGDKVRAGETIIAVKRS